jgi:tetratricopeptide (TPR) repeat protein
MALANFYTKMSNVTEALKLARQAVILDPTNGEIHSFIQEKDKSPQFLELSNSFLKQSIGNEERDWTKKEDYARTLIESTIEKMEASPESNNESLKELQQALEILKKLQLKFDQIPEIHFLLGQVYFLLDDNTNAVNAYKKALNLNISSSESYQFLALEYMLQNQNDKARDALEQALKYSPNNSEAWQQLARLEKRLGNTQEATSSYEKAIKFKPNKLTNYLELGRLLTENGDPNSAKELLESAMKIDSENPQLLKLLLITLQNPELKVTPDERDNIQKQRNNIFNKLQKIGK